MKRKELEAQALVAFDALESEDLRAHKLLAPVLQAVRAHGEGEGRNDYEVRAEEAADREDPEWAWPFGGTADAYLDAMGSYEITKEIGIPERLWPYVSDTWLTAFEHGYVTAYREGSAHARKKTTRQLDYEIADFLGKSR